MRRVRFFLGSFRVVVPIEQAVSLEKLYGIRDAVSQTFRDAQAELIRDASVLESPIRPHVFVSEIRQGSLDIQVIYHGVIDLPWRDISHVAVETANQGLLIVERLGAVAAGLETFRRIGSWLAHRIFQNEQAKEVVVRHESSLEANPHALSNSDMAREEARALLHDTRPRALLVVLDESAASTVRDALRVSVERNSRLGGLVIVHDMNMMMNGVSNLEELPLGSPFCLHNPAAIGLHLLRDSESLFDACANPLSGLTVDDLTLDHAEFDDERPIVDGPSIDSDDLPG